MFKYNIILNDSKLPVLVKESEKYYPDFELTQPDIVSNYMKENFKLDKMAEEYLYMIGFTTSMRPIGTFEISHGSVNQSICSPREILLRLLLCGASSFVLVHNHPSGKLVPSHEDELTTKRIYSVADMMNIPLKDHIIVSNEGYYSFAEHSKM